MMVIPSHGFVDKGIFMAGFGLPDFERFEDFLRGWQKSSYLQRVLRLETEHVGGVTVYKANGRKCGWRKNECSMENAFSFARVLPENLDGRRFGFLDEANETLAIIGMSKAQLDACKVGMSYDEKLAEAAAIAAMPGGRDFLYERFDRQFIRDVEFFLKNTRGTGEK